MKKNNIPLESIMPPQEVELEKAILGILLTIPDSINEVQELLKPDCFYNPTHKDIYSAIIKLKESGSVIDILTVTAYLKKNDLLEKVGGAYAIASLATEVTSAAPIKQYAYLVNEKWIAREIIRISYEHTREAFNDQDPFDLLDSIEKEISDIRAFISGVEPDKTLPIILDERHKAKVKMVQEGLLNSGISTKNKKLDEVIGGFVKTNLIYMAARPGMGKSVKAMNFAKSVAEQGHGVMFFSLEMSADELVDRLIVEECNIPLHLYRANKINSIDLERIAVGIRNLKKLPIEIIDKASIKPSFVKRKAEVYKRKNKNNLGLIIIDYVQLMRSDEKSTSREQEISSISRNLKSIAKELDVPVIALAQLSREVERTNDKRPELSHLRESGSLEQDADVIMFIYRPSYYFDYGKHPDEEYSMDSVSQSDYDLAAELLIAKNRNGVPNAKIKEKFYGMYSLFKEFSMQETPFEVEGESYNNNQDIIPF